MGVAWSHCPLCELKQPGSLPLPPPCAGALGHLPHVLPPAASALHQELSPNALRFPHHPSLHRYAHCRGFWGCVWRGGAEEERLCFASSRRCSPTAPPGSQPEKLQAPLTPAGVLPGLERCGRGLVAQAPSEPQWAGSSTASSCFCLLTPKLLFSASPG